MPIDYSKWDSIDVSDSDESISDQISEESNQSVALVTGDDSSQCKVIHRNSRNSELGSDLDSKSSHSSYINVGITMNHSRLKVKPSLESLKSKSVSKVNGKLREMNLNSSIQAALPGYSLKHKNGQPNPTQRIQYQEAWNLHKKYFENSKYLKFNPKIHIHANDNIADIHPIFFTDPNQFVPIPSENKSVMLWGLEEIYDDICQTAIHTISSQYLYSQMDHTDNCIREPAVQFVNVLINRKELEIQNYRKSKKSTKPLDYILDISLKDIKPKIFRRITVSSSMRLSTFQDKILCPLFGWCRNYHGYIFTDLKDGAQFGPVECSLIDMMHLPLNGYVVMDDTKYTLEDLFKHQKQKRLQYTYDLGDHFEHLIELIDVYSEKDSIGQCLILDGAMAPLPEDSVGMRDMRGNEGYQALLDTWSSANNKRKRNIERTVLKAKNYLSKKFYDPFYIDISDLTDDLAHAFPSRFSRLKRLSRGICENRQPSKTAEPGKPPGIQRSMRKQQALCGYCGNPNNLRSCGSEHWSHHMSVCKRLTTKRLTLLEKLKKKNHNNSTEIPKVPVSLQDCLKYERTVIMEQ
ncbi:hypothetical protein HDV02_001099 [Globomyces sp. JEL0801]|nr:hypothetical protein HDV02_001099 [Globomyces sp. JEL0801]